MSFISAEISSSRLVDKINMTQQQSDGFKYFYPICVRGLSILDKNPSYRISYAVCLPLSIVETVFFAVVGGGAALIDGLSPDSCATDISTRPCYQLAASSLGVKACVKGIFNSREGARCLRNAEIKFEWNK